MMRLELTGLSVGYEGTQILEPVTMTLEPGLVWLSGRNGSGKSTLLRTLVGAQPSYVGIMRLNGVEEKTQPVEYRRQLFFSDSDDLPLPWLAPKQWGRLANQLFPYFDSQRWQYWLRAFGLTATEQLSLSELSLGTRRKHQHAVTLSCGCDFLVFDEPYNALDMEACQVLEAGITEAVSAGALVIVASHTEPKHLKPTRLLHLDNGKLIQGFS